MKPDTTIYMKDLHRLNRHDIGVRLGECNGKEDLTRAILIYGESLVQVRADASGVIQRFVPSPINDVDVPYILQIIECIFGTLLMDADA